MTPTESIGISRRRLFEIAGLSAGAAVLARRPLFAKDEGIVPTMINEAAKAKISVQPIRRNISVLEGSGGNIAVLTGRDDLRSPGQRLQAPWLQSTPIRSST